MARRDGTGPMGQGAMTGRDMGACIGNISRRSSYARNRFNGGQGRGFGAKGFRCRQGFGGYMVEEPINTMSEKEWLSKEKSVLEEKLNLLNKELDNSSDE